MLTRCESVEADDSKSDHRQIYASPAWGPALSISSDGRYHMTWYSPDHQSNSLFYAWSDDQGVVFSEPLAFGRPNGLVSRPEVLAIGARVVLVWKESFAAMTQVMSMCSIDSGVSWSPAIKLVETRSASAYPALITDGNLIFLSWNSLSTGFILLPVG